MTIEERVPLAFLTTFKIGGPARYFCRVTSRADLAEAVAFANAHRVPILSLGGGSNTLISDEGFNGLIVKMDILGIEFVERGEQVEVRVGAGEVWDTLVALSVEKGLHGLENLSGIPGTVGAAPIQNIGAYGAEVAGVVKHVKVFDVAKKKERIFSRRECKFRYRDSMFKQKGNAFVITEVVFSLPVSGQPNISYKDLKEYFEKKKKQRPDPAEVRKAVLAIRSRKFPALEDVGTAGSFFKNPVVTRAKFMELKRRYPELPGFPAGKGKVKISLAWIIDHVCKLKNVRVGDAGVWERQALVLCNFGNATSEQVYELARQIRDTVRKAVDIEIEPEVRIIDAK